MSRVLASWLALVVTATTSVPALAWDPSRTHVGITERAVQHSEVHSRWMEGSAKQRGWFSPVRVDPSALDPEVRRLLVVAMRKAHADVGAIASGGPGACPPLPAPPETRQRCVDGDLWETTALGWVRIGIALEVAERDRLLHHFVDAEDPTRASWRVRGSGQRKHKLRWRRIERKAGGPVAAIAGRSGFAGEGQSAVGWFADRSDPFAPPAMHANLRLAALAATHADRDRHFALGLVGVGALLHVVQDLSMPAHARGDLDGLMVPLSPELGDRGSPLAEAARLAFGRSSLPEPIVLLGRPEPEPDPTLANDLHAVLFGDATHEGVVELAAGRFLSDGSMPAPRIIEDGVDAAGAAKLLLGKDNGGLLPVEVEGIELTPWPAESGYLRNGAGRALAAWSRDEAGIVRLYLDRHVLRQQALALLPVAVDATARVLDGLFPMWPASTWDADGDVLEMDADPQLHGAELTVVAEGADGRRTVLRRVRLLAERSRIRDVTPATLPKDASIVLVLEAKRVDGTPVLIERRLDADVVAAAEAAAVEREVPAPLPTEDPTATPSPFDPTDPESVGTGLVTPAPGEPPPAAEAPPGENTAPPVTPPPAEAPPVEPEEEHAPPVGTMPGEAPIGGTKPAESPNR